MATIPLYLLTNGHSLTQASDERLRSVQRATSQIRESIRESHRLIAESRDVLWRSKLGRLPSDSDRTSPGNVAFQHAVCALSGFYMRLRQEEETYPPVSPRTFRKSPRRRHACAVFDVQGEPESQKAVRQMRFWLEKNLSDLLPTEYIPLLLDAQPAREVAWDTRIAFAGFPVVAVFGYTDELTPHGTVPAWMRDGLSVRHDKFALLGMRELIV